jgi:multiple sugar transport system substrate-binding protein
MSKKRLLQALGVVMMLAMILSACAPAVPEATTVSEQPTSAPAQATSAPAEPTTAPAEPTSPPEAEQVELTVWSRFPEMQTLLQELGDAYTKEHPNVKVTATLFAQRALDEKIAVALPAGEAGDIIENDGVSIFPYYELGAIAVAPQQLTEFAQEHIAKSLVQENLDEQGNLYAMPFFTGIQTMFYNKDYFTEAGLECCPQTLDELMDYAQKLTKYDASGNITRAGLDLRLGGGGYGVAEKFWAMAMVPYGVAPVKQVDGGWQEGYDNEDGQKALQFYLDALFKYKVDSPEVQSDAEGFGLGLGAMFQRESWVIGYLAESAPDINYGTFMMVKGPNDWGTVGSTSALSVSENSKNKEVAFDFIEFALNPENQVKLLDDTGWLPVRTDVDYSSIYAEKPAFETFIKSLDTPGYTIYAYPRIAPALEIVGKIADGIVPTFSEPELVDQPEKVAEIVHNMADETNRILDDNDLLAK